MRNDEKLKAGLLGFWVFLMSDALIFSLLFAVYATQLQATDAGPGNRDVVALGSSLAQTLVLLSSSFTVAMAAATLRYRPDRLGTLSAWLVATVLLGLAFIGMELHDVLGLIDKGAVPQRSGYLSAFYALVGTHGLHVTAGCAWIMIMLVQLRVFGLDAGVKFGLACLALYWHLLDIIWVGLYGVVYLQGLIA